MKPTLAALDDGGRSGVMSHHKPKHANGSRGRRAWFVGGTVIATMGIMIGALAAIPDSNGIIHGCYNPTKGYKLRVIDTAKTQRCPSGQIALDWNQQGPQGEQGPPATLPAGTITGAKMSVGSLDPNTLWPAASEKTESCPTGLVAVAGSGWYVGGSGTSNPILVQIADSNSFRSFFEVDWSPYYDQLTPSSRVSWMVTCASVSP
jgi:hypothetical protein